MQTLEIIKRAIKDAIKSNQRRLIVLTGENPEKYLLKVIKDVVSIIKYKKVLFVTHDLNEKKDLSEKLRNVFKNIGSQFKELEYKETEKVMGTTQDFLILDLTKNLRPNDLGRLVETVRGGGIIIFLTPPFRKWNYSLYHETLITPPYTIKDIRNVFIPWFIKKLLSAKGTVIIDIEKKKITENLRKVKTLKEENLNIPKNTKISQEIYKMCLTQDQIETLQKLEEIAEAKEFAGVIIADRGRGKSAAVGLFLAGLIEQYPKIKIGITSPSPENVATFFEFLIKGLEKIGLRPKLYKNGENIEKVRVKKALIEYKKPLRLVKKSYSIVFVDEAAGIPITFLYKIYEKFDKIIFSSTIHGYEGAGRSFSVRFMKRLKENPKKRIALIRMKKPIRYSEDDPIEKFLYNALLLNAEPKDLNEKDISSIKDGKIKYIQISPKDLFEKEDLLTQFIGIYVLAHYRNRPNDLMLLADAPHHFPRMIIVNNKVINAIQLAKEGGLPEEWIKRMMEGEAPSGNIIPDRIMKYYGNPKFGKEVGYRIVRIATHPDVMGMGIGSFALKEIEKEAKKKKFGWIGAGFGVNYELLKFWIKNGFIPVHISPERNEVSGEYSIIVIKPLKKEIKDYIVKYNEEFRIKLLECLPELYSDMEPEVVRLLLKKFSKKKYKLDLTESQIHRLKGFAKGIFTMETVFDVIKIVTRWYFLNGESFLYDFEENCLIVKILQHNRWKFTQEILKMKRKDIRKKIRKAIRKILDELDKKGTDKK